MTTQRLEAFSDGVIAIVITIMVLELKVPHDPTWRAFGPVVPTLLNYLLSFIFVGIYWNNHHHLLQVTERVSGGMLWANLHLLFWLSLIPFVTSWMGESRYEAVPTSAYGIVLLMCAVAFTILQAVIRFADGPDSKIARAVRDGWKEKVSLGLYLASIGLAYVSRWLADACFLAVALLWLVPDRRVERVVEEAEDAGPAQTQTPVRPSPGGPGEG